MDQMMPVDCGLIINAGIVGAVNRIINSGKAEI